MSASIPDRSPVAGRAAQEIAESLFGPLQWKGSRAYMPCPGVHLHSRPTAATDCKCEAEPFQDAGATYPPGVYCHHDSCRPEVEAASFSLRSALGKRAATRESRPRVQVARLQPPTLVFQPHTLERIAAKLPAFGEEQYAARSKKRVDNRTPASVLHELFRPGEKVPVFRSMTDQGDALWEHQGVPFDARELNGFSKGARMGVWFLNNPVTGEFVEYATGGETRCSRRSWRTVTAWRYLVLESDQAAPELWLAALAQLPLPISCVTTSGGKSIHALVKLDAESKSEWDSLAAKIKRVTIPLGADRKAITAVRLTRLAECDRMGTLDAAGRYHRYATARKQRLLYLNDMPDGTPISEQEAY